MDGANDGVLELVWGRQTKKVGNHCWKALWIQVSTYCLFKSFFVMCARKCFWGSLTAEDVKEHVNNTRKTETGSSHAVNVCLWELVAESVWHLKTQHPAASNIQQAASTLRSNPSRLQSCSQAFNKQRKWHITPSLSLKSCIGERKKKPSPVI